MENIKLLQKELKMWKKDLEEIENSSIIGGVTEGGSSGVIGDRTGNRATRIADLKMKIEQTILNIMAVIEEEEDTLMRQVLNYRCIHGYSWKKISRLIYGTSENDGALRIMYYRYVTNVTDEVLE